MRALDPQRLVFLDETGSDTAMTRRYGRAAPGERVVEGVPQGHWARLSTVGSLRLDGTTTAMVLEGACDTDSLLAYAEHVLCPSLRPGDVVIPDNLSSHHDARFRALIEGTGARLVHLPPYSPDFNPIEKLWSKVKEYLRTQKARTLDALVQAWKEALATVTAEDACGWFGECGYATPAA